MPDPPLGTFDAFRDVAAWSDATARGWIDTLNRRAAADDQRALRSLILELAALGPGDRAVEVGCGTGALLCEMARIVGREGRVLGVEPQPRLVEAARQLVAAEGLAATAAVECGSAERLPIEGDAVAACVAQTVLIHLPDAVLRRALAEMARVVRPGGRVVSADQDGDTWTIDHPDRELTRRIVRFNSDQRYADGWTGRRLRRLFRAAGLEGVAVRTMVHVDTEAGTYLFEMAERIAGAAMDAGAVAVDEGRAWLDQLRQSAAQGDFFSSINFYIAAGFRGPR
jgi:ubiquinone/menaquinone biosynthesis C-methylase UbiE